MAEGFSARRFYDDLVEHRLIIPVGVPGVFGRGAVFEDVLRPLRRAHLARSAAKDGAEVMAFPPTLDRKVFEKSEYLDSFPQLAGSVFSFTGTDRTTPSCASGPRGPTWAEWQTMTDVVLYARRLLPGVPKLHGDDSGAAGTWSTCRTGCSGTSRLPSRRACRRSACASSSASARRRSSSRGATCGSSGASSLLHSLGLPAKSDVACGSVLRPTGGRMLAGNQREQKLKFEVLVPVISEEKPTAVCSFNYHQDHFGKLFDIKTPDGRPRADGLPRLRPGAVRHGALQDARDGPIFVAGGRAQSPLGVRSSK